MSETDIELRLATMSDAEQLLQWRNDPETIAASITDGQVELDDHMQWLQRVLKDENRKLYIVQCKGRDVGTVRADYEDGTYALSWTVAPDHRGQGYGFYAVKTLIEGLDHPYTACVKNDNLASQKIAERLGMVVYKEEQGLMYYKGEEI